MGQLSSTQIDCQIAKLNEAITAREAEHKDLAFQYAETADDQFKERMVDVRKTIDYYKDEIDSLKVAREAALSREAEDHSQEVAAEHKKQVARLKELLDKRVAVAKKLDKRFSDLGKTMDEFRSISQECHASNKGLINNTYDLVSKRMFHSPPQVFGWRNAIFAADITELAAPNYSKRFNNATYQDVTIADGVAKQHEMLGAQKLITEESDNAE